MVKLNINVKICHSVMTVVYFEGNKYNVSISKSGIRVSHVFNKHKMIQELTWSYLSKRFNEAINEKK